MYNKLNESSHHIRLLRLLAGQTADDIHCELFVVSLEDVEDYEALSYVWGASNNTLGISVNQQNMQVTTNLESALRQLRRRDCPRVLWVDAICINQADWDEKSSQVQLMREIYSSAAQVVVWLGPAERGRDDLATITFINRQAADPELHWSDIEDDISSVGLAWFLGNRWWTRIWTVQEAVLAKRVIYQCGEGVVSGHNMRNMISSFFAHAFHKGCCNVGDGAKNGLFTQAVLTQWANTIRDLLHVQSPNAATEFDLIDVLTMFRERHATNPADKVYGLLGISRGIDKTLVDYRLPASKVYELSTRELIQYHENLDVLSHCRPLKNCSPRSNDDLKISAGAWDVEVADLPSWAPDWSGGRSFGANVFFTTLKHWLSSLKSYRSCGHLKITHSASNTPGVLVLTGVYCDTITQIGEVASSAKERFSRILEITQWRGMVEIDDSPNKAYIAGGTIVDAFWRTLCGDIIAETTGRGGSMARMKPGTVHEYFHISWWYQELLRDHGGEWPGWTSQPSLIMNLYTDHLAKTATNRRFIISEKGYIGLAPPDTRAGDMICVFAGGKVPFIIRPLDLDEASSINDVPSADQPRYQLVGDSYIHGLMDGEAVATVDEDPSQLRTFHLV